MCDVYHVVGIVTTYGLTVALGCLPVHLLSISAAGRLCEVSVHVCVLLSLDYCMYFYTYILYVTSVF